MITKMAGLYVAKRFGSVGENFLPLPEPIPTAVAAIDLLDQYVHVKAGTVRRLATVQRSKY